MAETKDELPVARIDWKRMAAKAEAELAAAQSRINALLEGARLLDELHQLVWGECPSLLNEDSGGNSSLDLAISSFLASLSSGRSGSGDGGMG